MIRPLVMQGLMATMAGAAQRHGKFPTDIVRAVAIVAEESGEAVKAALDCTRDAPTAAGIEELRAELYQTASAALHMIQMLDSGEWNSADAKR